MCIKKVLIIIILKREFIEHFQGLRLKKLYNLMKEKHATHKYPHTITKQ